jgi:hypothetical protein
LSAGTTLQVVEDLATRLPLRYHFQPDLGWRTSTARNAGARLTNAPVLVFADSGMLPGPGFLGAHLAAHSADGPGQAVIGYALGYRPGDTLSELKEAIRAIPLEQVFRDYRRVPSVRDPRHLAFEAARFGFHRDIMPWQQFWSLNCSVRAADFWAVCGFDEDFRSWGKEDLELGYRLFHQGLRFRLCREAWAVHTPHDREPEEELRSSRDNMLLFLRKHPDPVLEMLYAWILQDRPWYAPGHDWYVEDEYGALTAAADAVRMLDVTVELMPLSRLPAGTRVAVLGAGGKLPAGLPPAVLFDYDKQLLDRLSVNPAYPRQHAIGIRTSAPDSAFDVVVVTSRLAPLWGRWGREILAEAHRIGRAVQSYLADSGPTEMWMVDQ